MSSETRKNYSFEHSLAEYRNLIDAILFKAFDHGQPESLYQPAQYVFAEGGKRLRPLLTMLCAGATGGKPEQAAGCGAALEILHNFTLVHDDIMDRSPLRRGRQTVHMKWNEATAILSGDAMLGIAYQLLINETRNNKACADILAAFTKGLIDVCEGQAMDLDFHNYAAVSMQQYLDMIHLKTARLLEIAAQIGALYSNAETRYVDALIDYARSLGIAFQIQDDIMDLKASQAEFGKVKGQDLLEGKKSYLIVAASLKVKHPDDIALMQHYLESKGIHAAMIPDYAALFERNDIYSDAYAMIGQYLDKARTALQIFPDSQSVQALLSFTDMVQKRNT
jgi:geranylgeranyl diphosphate synthase type II